jgi:hypothetical protein
VRYIPDWERLADSLARVTALGLEIDEAQVDLCRAIADGKIRVRPSVNFLSESNTDRQLDQKLAGKYRDFVRAIFQRKIPFDLGSWLQPNQLDWEHSSIKARCRFEPGMEGFPGPPREAVVTIEISTADVLLVISAAGEQGEAGLRGAPVDRRRSKNSPALERATIAIRELYPAGVPQQHQLRNVELCQQVSAKLQALLTGKQKLSPVSDDTILRAAGRRK